MTDSDQTIAAVATAPGEGGIGIIRISGPRALDCGLGVFSPRCSKLTKDNIRERHLYLGAVLEGRPSGSARLDTAMMAYMRAPCSYTGEDVVELHCHGGILVLRRVLELVLKGGASPAGPGEFTKRAFLNGRMDLAQAESVIDVIRSATDTALASASARLSGGLSVKIREIKDILLGVLAGMEAALDFPEEEGVSAQAAEAGRFRADLAVARGLTQRLLETCEEGRALKDGVGVLILGRTNAGKSSLLNVLLRAERAIVTPVPGTTRDVIEETVDIRGLPVRLMDTAGLRETCDSVESIGVERARERIAGAGVILYVLDSTAGLDEDLGLMEECRGRNTIVAANKADLIDEAAKERIGEALSGRRVCFISATRGTGIEGLKDAIFETVAGHGPGAAEGAAQAVLVASLRHRKSLEDALDSMERAESALGRALPLEFPATDVRAGIDALGEIIGETTTEDLLEEIFSGFCIGK